VKQQNGGDRKGSHTIQRRMIGERSGGFSHGDVCPIRPVLHQPHHSLTTLSFLLVALVPVAMAAITDDRRSGEPATLDRVTKTTRG
jgi:hypothetical protein